MKFELGDLDKRTVLRYVTEQQIFMKYLGLTEISLSKHYINTLPGRNDNDAGCSFFLRDTDGRLIFRDWAKDWHGDCFDIVQAKFGCSFAMALSKVASDFKLVEGNVNLTPVAMSAMAKPKPPLAIQIKRRNFTQIELAFWNVGGLIVDQKTLEQNKIFAITAFWEFRGEVLENYKDRLNMHFAYQFYEKFSYQVYRPEFPRDRRRFINAKGLQYGDIEFLDKEQDYVVITKSKKDAFILRQLGVNAFFIVHEAINLPIDLMYKLKDRYDYVFTLFDNDATGKRQSIKYKMRHGTTPLMYDKHEGKDTYQITKKNGMLYMIDLIHSLKRMYNL